MKRNRCFILLVLIVFFSIIFCYFYFDFLDSPQWISARDLLVRQYTISSQPSSSAPPLQELYQYNNSSSNDLYDIDLSTYDPTDLSYVILKDVCIEDIGSNKTRIVAYRTNMTTMQRQYNVKVYTYAGNRMPVYWPVLLKKSAQLNNRIYKPYPVFFLYDKYPHNLFHFVHDGLIGLFGLMEETARLNASTGNHILRYHCTDKLTPYMSFIKHLGPNLHYGECFSKSSEKNICFEHGIFGFKLPYDRESFVRYYHKAFGVDQQKCNKSRIVFLDRGYRRISNVDELKQGIEDLRLNNTEVEVVRFEGYTVEEQMEKIHCTHILIGVQGAGMEWYRFLPHVSGVLELGWKKWPPVLYAHVAQRRGLVTDTYTIPDSKAVIDWDRFTRGKNITEAEKEKAKRFNGPSWKASNPYKVADGTFDVKIVVAKIRTIIMRLEKRGLKF